MAFITHKYYYYQYILTAYIRKLDKNKFTSTESDVVVNELYKTAQDKGGQREKDASHYSSDFPVSYASQRPQSGTYNDGLAPTTHNHNVKQSDNPLYSSTQELGLNINSVLPRSSSVPPRVLDSSAKIDRDPNYAVSMLEDKGNSNRLSYGLELELSNQKNFRVRHQRSLSQGVDPVYTEL